MWAFALNLIGYGEHTRFLRNYTTSLEPASAYSRRHTTYACQTHSYSKGPSTGNSQRGAALLGCSSGTKSSYNRGIRISTISKSEIGGLSCAELQRARARKHSRLTWIRKGDACTRMFMLHANNRRRKLTSNHRKWNNDQQPPAKRRNNIRSLRKPIGQNTREIPQPKLDKSRISTT